MKIIIDDDDVKAGLACVSPGTYAAKLTGVAIMQTKGVGEIHLSVTMGTVPLHPRLTVGDHYYRIAKGTWRATTFQGRVVKASAHQYVVAPAGQLERSGHVYEMSNNITDIELSHSADPELLKKEVMERCCHDVIKSMMAAGKTIVVPPLATSPKQAAIDALPTGGVKPRTGGVVRGLKNFTQTIAELCPECFGTGEWTNPAGGRDATTPCSRGCQKP